VGASQGIIMTDSHPENADTLRAIAALRGLGRALALFPDTVATAFERGRRPIGSFPDNFSPLTEPASRFAAEPETGAKSSAETHE
jgi:hypothetical protein